MKRVYTTSDIVRLMTIKSLLETEGIPFMVKNENLTYLAGELPFGDVQPEIWVEDDDFEKAKRFLKDNLQD